MAARPAATRILWTIGILILLWAGGRFGPAIGDYFFRILILSGLAIILAVSLNIVNGFAGQFSLGHAGFMAVGAYTSAALTHYKGQAMLSGLTALGVPTAPANGVLLAVAIALGAACAGLTGLCVSLPSFRLRGDYLAIVTLGFGEVVRVVLLNIDAVGGARGLSNIPTITSFAWVYAFAIVTVVISRNLALSSHGRALFALRDDEVAAQCVGVNVLRSKVMAFVISAALAGVAGALHAHYDGYIAPNGFGFMKSIEIVAMVVLGGMGSVTGAVLAAVVLTGLPEALRAASAYRMVLYSAVIIVLMLRRPQGILGRRELSLDQLKSLWSRGKGRA
jgi:branched-chain amino acid transport system permease protein